MKWLVLIALSLVQQGCATRTVHCTSPLRPINAPVADGAGGAALGGR